MSTFDAAEVPGFHPGVSYLVAGAWVEYDTRELPPLRAYGSRFSPSQERLQGLSLDARRGLNASAELRHYLDMDGGDYGFSRLMLESQQYVPFAKGRLVLALREYGSFSQAAEDEVIPFYMMQPLGGVRSLRGFDNFRFRDQNLMLLNAELRWHIWRPLQLAVFTDAGHVFRRLEDVSVDDLEVGCGAGARLLFGGRVFMRLELAHSREGMTTYVKLGSFL
jgi:hemolysin activation/secretion protein